MKAYCLTLKETPERRAAASAQFKAAGVDVEFVEGFHGPTLGLVPRLTVHDNREERLKPGKVGLFLSFLFLFRLILDRGSQDVMIFEDDVILEEGFRDRLEEVARHVPDDWQVIHLGHCCTEGKPFDVVAPGVHAIRYPLCNHGLILKREAIELIVSRLTSISSALDVTLSKLVYPSLNCYALVPPIVRQRDYAENRAKRDRDSIAQNAMSWKDIDGWFNFSKLYDEALDRVKDRAIFIEVGTWKGKSAAYMATEIKRRMLPVDFFACDTWTGTPGHPVLQAEIAKVGGDMLPIWKRNMLLCGVANHVTPIEEPSPTAAARFADASVDFVFIDGDHSFGAVVADIRAWRPKLRPGGVMAGHDVDRASVLTAVKQEFGARFRTWERCWIAL